MKLLMTWSILIGKRLCKKPLFLFSLLLIPLLAWSLQLCMHSKEGALKVAVYTDSTAADSLENRLIDRLSTLSSSAVTFYRCSSEAELRQDVDNNNAGCGYIFPKQLDELLAEHITSYKPVITIYRHKDEVTSRLVDEVVYSQLYSDYSYKLVRQHIRKQTGSVDEEALSRLYESYRTGYTFIRYEYADGTKNTVLSNKTGNYMLFPLRGMTAVFILLTGLLGTLFWQIDKERQVFVWLKTNTHRIKLLYLWIPTLLGGTLGIITIAISGLGSSPIREITAMLCYTIAVVGFCDFVSSLTSRSTTIPAIIPIATVGSILLCPVFTDLTKLLPIIRPLRHLTPVSYYLSRLYSPSGRWIMVVYGIVGITAGFLLQKRISPRWQ